MKQLDPLFLFVFCLGSFAPCLAQSSNATAGAAGLAAGAALTGGASQNSTTSSSAGAANAPIEMNVIVYGGIKKISLDIATSVANAVHANQTGSPDCHSGSQVLLEDSTTMPLISLHASWEAMVDTLTNELSSVSDRLDQDVLQIGILQQQAKDAISEVQAAVVRENSESENAKPRPKGRKGAGQGHATSGYGASPLNAAPGAGAPAAAPSTAGSPTAGGAASTPIGLTYLGDIGTAISTLKSGLSYAASSVSPASQALTAALTKDLCAKNVALYTSASTINLKEASQEVAARIVHLQELNADIQAATNYLTTLPSASDPTLQSKLDDLAQRIKVISTRIASEAASANLLLSTFLSWEAGSDGNGGIVLTDVIRARMLADVMAAGIPALQVNIDAAGGNTRTNNYFFFNLFYTPKPSFNGGVVITYELRDAKNIYIAGDTLKALYDYTKWKPSCFGMATAEVNDTSLGIGAGVSKSQKQHIACQPQTVPPQTP